MKKICAIHGVIEVNSQKDKCPKCLKMQNKNYDETKRSQSSNKIYQSKQWRDIRTQALKRDLYCCVSCNKPIGLKVRDHAVDHIEEIKDRGSAFDLKNLQTLCQSCHNIKTNLNRRG